MFTLYLVLFVCVVLVARLVWRHRGPLRLYRCLGSCFNTLPVVEHLLRFIGNKEHVMKLVIKIGEHAAAHGGLSSYWVLNKLYVVVANAEVADVILKQHLEKDELMSKLSKLILRNSLLCAPVPIWRRRRRAMVSLFSHSNVISFQPIFAKNCSLMMDKMADKVGGDEFCVYDYCNALAFDSACNAVLGLDISSLSNPDDPLRQAVNYIAHQLFSAWVPPVGFNYFEERSRRRRATRGHRAVIYDHVNQALSKYQAERETKEAAGGVNNDTEEVVSLMSLIMHQDSRHRLTAEEIHEEALLLLLAATDTSSASLAFAILMLAWYPDIQDKAFREVQEVVGLGDEPVSATHLPHLRYLDAVMRESQRLFPVAPIITRRASSNVVLPSGLEIPAGTNILVHIWALNRCPQRWGADAAQFRPERLLQAGASPPILSFSSGARACPGVLYSSMLLKTALAELLRRCRVLPSAAAECGQVSPSAATHHTPDSPHLLYSGTMRAAQYSIRLVARNNN